MSTIVMKGGTFEPLYTDPNYFYMMSEYWWKKHKSTFQSWWDVFDIEYAPLENYDRHEIIHEDTADVGTLDSATTSRQVVDQDTTGTSTTHSTSVLDSDTTGSETTSGREVTDDDATHEFDRTETRTPNTTDKIVKSGKVVEVMSDRSSGTLRAPGASGSNETTSTHSVSAFDSNSYEPADRTVTSTNRSEDTSGSDDRTTTTTYDGQTDTTTRTGTETVRTVEDGSATDDKTVTTSGSKTASGTEDATTTFDSRDNDVGTLDSTTNATGSVDQDTTNDRDFDRTAWIHGNIGVKTTQSMLLEELQVRAWNIYEHMADIFVDELCVRVY